MGGDVKMPGKGNRGKAFSGVAAATTGTAEIGVPGITAGAWTKVARNAACARTGVCCNITGS